MQERERPKIAPKPIIATKPKYVPPVKIQQRPVASPNPTATAPPCRRTSLENFHHPERTLGDVQEPARLDRDNRRISGEYADKEQVLRRKTREEFGGHPRHQLDPARKLPPQQSSYNSKAEAALLPRENTSYFLPQNDKEPLYPRRELMEAFTKRSYEQEPSSSLRQETQVSQMTTFVSEKCDKFYRKTLEVSQKPPNSPSTVCCSILSNAATDCCGIINMTKNELNGKLSKLESVDSNSSDSGGFKDFIPAPIEEASSMFHHQRKISQPEFLNDRKLSEARPIGHQRKSSQPNFDSSRKNYVANAQALAQFLPQTEQKILMHNQKSEEARTRQPKSILSQGNIQQSTKKLEELLAQRLEKDKLSRKGAQNCLIDGAGEDVEQKMRIQRQIQQKLHADLEQTVKQIQEIQSTEYRLPQNRKWNESNRSQPAIGLKHTPKSRPTIFGTVASDLTPKDCSNRRSLPQTPTIKSFSTIFSTDSNQDSSVELGIQQDNALVYRDGNLLSGSLEALIQHMVPTESYYPDRAYLFAFLLSARLFIKPHDLLAQVRALGDQQQGLGESGSLPGASNGPQQMRFVEKMVQLLAEWTEQFPYDFRDERMMEHVRKITQQCCSINPTLRANVSLLLHNLHPRLTALEEYEKSLENQTNTASSDEHISCPDISDICPHPDKLAQQLTHVELERLSFIGPEEFVQAFAKENPALETSFKDLKKTRNLEQYVQWFNRLSYFVATQVCKYQKKKQRVKMVEFWIETGRECFNIGNFNSLMAIIAGLNMSPISRLKKTWNKIQSGKFAILEHQMDPSSNFSSYRSTLKAAMWRSAGATDQRQRIVIPFFSLLVKDLYFLNQGCSSKLPNGHINFEKFWQLAKQVTEFMAWKQVTCPFEKDSKVISVLQHSPVLNENALARASFECEPPDNNQEKERCKTLKAEGGSNS
ncbi:ras-GEF domain-containing family member 1B-A [Dendroctonus ponderosae]|uniref:ras-GEF domain-containing family member 1B-A n=1 Tax=Dendroctonus ponderosae TaxID=77166 RepID=UPI002035D9D8|nr:ras-GEF domain-containing family member 1B-A [Dendroctonus ponderosae]